MANNIIDQIQYTVLVSVVILSAAVPTFIAQQRSQPTSKIIEEPDGADAPGTEAPAVPVRGRQAVATAHPTYRSG